MYISNRCRIDDLVDVDKGAGRKISDDSDAAFIYRFEMKEIHSVCIGGRPALSRL
jgi:hypothetical protein